MGEEKGVKRGKGTWRRQLGYCLLYFVYSFPVEPHRRRQLCVIEPVGEAWKEGRCCGVQLVNGLRLMKRIMRGASRDFCAQKGGREETVAH